MSKKILFTASTMSHIEHFHLPYLKAFEDLGWEVKAVALPVSKSFFSLKNLGAINYTRKLLKSERFDVVSSHSTLAGIVTRLAVILLGKSRRSMKIFHTAHGYLFHDDNSMKKWVYILPEMLCGKVTDVLMVMNHEDLAIAKKYKLCGKSDQIYYINGMGIDLSRFQTSEGEPLPCTAEQKASFGLSEEDFAFVYAAEFSKRKNHQLLLRGFASFLGKLNEFGADCSTDQIKLVLAGDGALQDEMKALASQLGISEHVIFLGYIKNIRELYTCCDVAVSTSKIEGLPFNIMEAMACGLPVVASDIKGHRELIVDGENGLLFERGELDELTDRMVVVCNNNELRELFIKASAEKIKGFSLEAVMVEVMESYEESNC